MTGDRLSINRIARRWAAEYDQADIQARDIEDDLLTAVLHGEFEFSVTPPFEFNIPPPQEFPEDPQEPEAPGPPKNFDARLRVLVETFDRDGAPVNSGKLQIFLNTRMNAPGARVEEARRFIARDIFISIPVFKRWCDRPEFAEWAQVKGLSRPQFIDAQGAIPSDPSLPQQSKKKTGRGGRKKGSGSLAQQDQSLIDKMKESLSGKGPYANMTIWRVAMELAAEAEGNGTQESKAKRLCKRYKEELTSQRAELR
jgi:hypothetical protein